MEVTGFGDPVRSFIQREPSPAELAEFRAALLREADTRRARSPAGRPEVIPPLEKARRRGQCLDCGDSRAVDIQCRCTYCAELADLRARNLPGPPLAAWWYLLPSVLGFTLGLVLVWAVLYVIFYS